MMSSPSTVVRSNGLIKSSRGAWLLSTVVVQIGTEESRVLRHPAKVVLPSGRDQGETRTIKGDLDVVRIFHATHQIERIAPEPQLDDVLAVDREGMLDEQTAARAWRHPLEMLIL